MGWLLVLAVTGAWLASQPLSPMRSAAALVDMFILALLYVWVTMRSALGPADIAREGPSAAVLGKRHLLLGAMVAVVVSVGISAPGAEAWWLIMYVIVAAGLALPPKNATIVIAILLAGTLLAAWFSGQFDAMLLIMIAFGAAASAMRQLTISVAQLGAARDELARVAVDQERLRFARDLHDILGHTLSVIILKSELAGRLLPSAPSEAASELADIERSAREAQRQVREAVVGYRQPELHRELAGAREMLTAAGVQPNVSAAVADLPSPIDGLLAWAVREGVTNVIRHSRAKRCDIDLTREDHMVRW
jgi:two-component system, NarL family, sensor histidine kinase DesK